MPTAQHNHRDFQPRPSAPIRDIFSGLSEVVSMFRGQLPEGLRSTHDSEMSQAATATVMRSIVEVLPTDSEAL